MPDRHSAHPAPPIPADIAPFAADLAIPPSLRLEALAWPRLQGHPREALFGKALGHAKAALTRSCREVTAPGFQGRVSLATPGAVLVLVSTPGLLWALHVWPLSQDEIEAGLRQLGEATSAGPGAVACAMALAAIGAVEAPTVAMMQHAAVAGYLMVACQGAAPAVARLLDDGITPAVVALVAGASAYACLLPLARQLPTEIGGHA